MSGKPHDGLFHWVFSQPEHARGELQHVLPAAIASRIDWSTLALCPGSFIDDDLAHSASDLLFQVRLSGQPALLHFLFEHQSKADRWLVFRDLAYEVRIWSWWRAKHPDAQSLPIILPVLLCHSPTPWSAPVRFEDLLAADADTLAAVADHVPRFRIFIDDLTAAEDAKLRGRSMTAAARVTLWALRHARNKPEMFATLEAWSDLLRELPATPDGLGAFRVLIGYILRVHRPKDEILPRFRAILTPTQVTEMLTAADELREEGRIEGERKGRIEGRIEGERALLTRLLTRRFGPLPATVTTRIEAAAADQLETWTDRAATEATLDTVFAATNAGPPKGSLL